MKASSPKIDDMTALGIWMLACVVMVFGALAEYGIILFLMFRQSLHLKKLCGNSIKINSEENFEQIIQQSTEKKEISENFSKNIKDNQSSVNFTDYRKDHFGHQHVDRPRAYRSLDLFSMKMFPTVFILFIVIYILYFTTAVDKKY